MADHLTDVARRWTVLGDRDPMWAALTNRGRSGRWDVDEFLRTGHDEIGNVLTLLDRRGVGPTMGTALDFGCGPGRLSSALAAAGFARVVGVDISPTMLAKAAEIVARSGAERCEFVLNTGASLDAVPGDTVDFVYSCRVLQHLPPALVQGYVREFLRIATPGAIVVFQLPAEPAGGAAGTALKLATRTVPGRLLDRARSGMQMCGASPAAVTRLVAEAGGVTVSIEEDRSAGPRWRSYLYLVRAKG